MSEELGVGEGVRVALGDDAGLRDPVGLAVCVALSVNEEVADNVTSCKLVIDTAVRPNCVIHVSVSKESSDALSGIGHTTLALPFVEEVGCIAVKHEALSSQAINGGTGDKAALTQCSAHKLRMRPRGRETLSH